MAFNTVKALVLTRRFQGRFYAGRGARLPRTLLVRMGKETKVHIGDGCCFRENTIINVSDNGHIYISDRVFINDGCCLNCREEIRIGSDTIIGQNVMFYDHDHDYRAGTMEKNNTYVSCPINIGSNVWIGSGVILLKGAVIGNNSIIAAGSVVNKSIPPNCLYYEKRDVRIKPIESNKYEHSK